MDSPSSKAADLYLKRKRANRKFERKLMNADESDPNVPQRNGKWDTLKYSTNIIETCFYFGKQAFTPMHVSKMCRKHYRFVHKIAATALYFMHFKLIFK